MGLEIEVQESGLYVEGILRTQTLPDIDLSAMSPPYTICRVWETLGGDVIIGSAETPCYYASLANFAYQTHYVLSLIHI